MNSGSRTGSNADIDRPLTGRHSDESPHQTNCAPNPALDSDADLKLVRRLLARDENAWQIFVRKYQRLVFHCVCAAAGELQIPPAGNDMLEDICAEVFSALLQRDMSSLRRFSGRSRLSTWLAVVTRRIALRSFGNSMRRARQADSAEMAMLQTNDSAVVVEQASRLEKLRHAVQQLSAADQQVLTLFYDQQCSYQDIAGELQISVNAVGPKLDRARRRLREVLRGSPTPFDEFEFITTPPEDS